MRLHRGLSLEDFWQLFPPNTEDHLTDLPADGRKGAIVSKVDGVGQVESWIDECSEGRDRGGYVEWYRLLDVLSPEGEPLVLEADTDGSTIFFSDRMTVLE